MEMKAGRRPEAAESVTGIVVNGQWHELSPPASGTLLALLRSGLGLTGAKPGCGEGECGACTVLVDGSPVLACQTAVAEVAGRSVTTVEGLADRQRLHPVQQALAAEHGFQCGYCTPAMALRAAALLASNPDPDDAAIAAALEPNVCRCGCYPRITRAVQRAAVLLRDPAQQGAEPLAEAAAPLARPGRPWDLCSPQDREWFDILGDGLVVVWPPPGAHGGAWVHLSPSGTVTAFTGKVDVGQDNRAAFRLLVAEELAVDPGSVRVVQGDTDLCPSDVGTFGSRSMPEAGEWLRRAAAGAREALLDLAAQRWRAGTRTGTAPDLATARRAVAVVEADWDTPAALPGPMADYLRSHPAPGQGWQQPVDQGAGEVEAALAGAAVTVRASYRTAYLAHVPMETRAAVAEWADGRLTVWTGNNVPFPVRARLAGAFGLAEHDVRVIVPPTGGGFGGKRGDEAIEAARLARAAGCPVKVHWSRAEEFQFGYVRPMAVIDIRAGLDRQGAIAAFDLIDINAGPQGTAFPYAAASWRLRYTPAASPLAQGPYRALAATANTFARESALDELARAATCDPLRFRLDRLADDRLAAVLRAAAGSAGSDGAGPRRGLGFAVGVEKDGRVATRAEVAADADGTVHVTRIVTAYECGAVVSPATVISQIQGGIVMALGGALFEQVTLADGHQETRSLAGYRVPRFSDIPRIDVVLVDRPDIPSAGAGETPLIAVAPPSQTPSSPSLAGDCGRCHSWPVTARSGWRMISQVGEDASEPTQAVRQAALAAGWSHRHRDVSGGRLRPTVFGAVDGLVTNASLIAGLAGGGAPPHIVILTGAAALVAGAFSMGTGEYISVTNQNELVHAEVATERRMHARFPDAEQAELADTFRGYGADPDTASRMAAAVSRDPDTALRLHTREELGVDPFALPSALAAGLSSLVAFSAGALLPLLPYLAGLNSLAAALGITAMALLAGGMVVGRLTGRPLLRSGLRQLALGGVAIVVTYTVGSLIGAHVT